MSISSDAELIREKGFFLKVMQKAEKGLPWETVEAKMTDLEQAVILAKTVTAYDVAVFVMRDFGGFMYWSNRHLDVLNSEVITMKFSNSADNKDEIFSKEVE